jgi:hypothetical protein
MVEKGTLRLEAGHLAGDQHAATPGRVRDAAPRRGAGRGTGETHMG